MSDFPEIHFYGAMWCGDCRRSKRFLDTHHVPFIFHDVDENPEASEKIKQLNNGMRRIPTIVFPDGSFLVEPSDNALSVKLGIPFL